MMLFLKFAIHYKVYVEHHQIHSKFYKLHTSSISFTDIIPISQANEFKNVSTNNFSTSFLQDVVQNKYDPVDIRKYEVLSGSSF
jgi:hypothetical protein